MAPSNLKPHGRTDDFLATLTPLQKRSLDQLKKWLGTPRVGLEWYRQVGALVADLRPSTQATYGTGWVETLAKQVGCSPAFIRKAHSLFQNYSPADVKRLHDRLTFDKIGLLLSIPDKTQRLQFQQLAIKEQWTYPRLMREIQRRLGVRRPRAGRPSPKPTNYGLEVGLQQLIRMAEKWMLHHQHVWAGSSRSVVGRIERLPPEKCTPELVEQLEEASRRLKEVQDAVGELQRVLPGLLKKVRSKLAEREGS